MNNWRATGLFVSCASVAALISTAILNAESPSGSRRVPPSPAGAIQEIRLDVGDEVQALKVMSTASSRWYGGPGFDGRGMVATEVVFHDVVFDGVELYVRVAALTDPATAKRFLAGSGQLGAGVLEAGLWHRNQICPGDSCWTGPYALTVSAGSVCYSISCAGLDLGEDDPLLNQARDTMLAFAEVLVRRQETLGIPSTIRQSPWLVSQVEPEQVPPNYAAVMVDGDTVDDVVEDGIALMSWVNGLVFDADAISDPAYVENLLVPAEPATRVSVIYRWFSSADAARAGADAARDFLQNDLEQVTPDSRWFTTARRALGDGEPRCPGDYCLASWRPPELTFVVQSGNLCATIAGIQADNRTAVSRTLAMARAIAKRERSVTLEQESE